MAEINNLRVVVNVNYVVDPDLVESASFCRQIRLFLANLFLIRKAKKQKKSCFTPNMSTYSMAIVRIIMKIRIGMKKN
jgi:hypothetical protein